MNLQNLFLAKDFLDGTSSSDLLLGGRVLSVITRSLEVIFDVENVFSRRKAGVWAYETVEILA